MKRFLDIVLAVVGLIAAAPLMALVALLVKLDSPGRVIFVQTRLGQGGRPFKMRKFRKFPDDWAAQGPGVTVAGDARMTRFGRFLERSKLDELPQLWNILRGDMSFVGPRPESLRYKDLFQGELARVLDFKPGIFGPNQVVFRNESEMYPPDRDPEIFYREELFPQKARNDIEYFSRASGASDLAWMARGLWWSFAGALNWRRFAALHGPILALDVLAIEAGWVAANAVRFLGVPPTEHINALWTGVWLKPLVLVPVLMLAGCYRQPVRYFSAAAAVRLGTASAIGWVIAELVLLGLFHRDSSIMLGPMALVFSLFMMGLPRIWHREQWRRCAPNGGTGSAVRVAVYGAGRRGVHLVPLLKQGFPNAQVVGFVEDNEVEMRGREVAGSKVLGSERDLNTIEAIYGIDQLWLTFEPDAPKHGRLETWCAENQVNLIVLPWTEPFTPLLRADALNSIQSPADCTSETFSSASRSERRTHSAA